MSGPFNQQESDELKKLNILERAITLRVNKKTLNGLYSNAILFVNPSLYEGLGMPILEAFANNCPVCLSNASCFPEIAGAAAVYFDPNDYDSILEAIKNVLYDDNFRKQLIDAGQARLVNFS